MNGDSKCCAKGVLGKLSCYHALLVKAVTPLQDLFIFVLRAYFGYRFLFAGLGKFQNMERTVGFFTKLGIPMPEVNAYLAGGAELIGGALLMVGLFSRVASIPLIFTMLIAYLTAFPKEFYGIFSDPTKFMEASPFLFLLTSLMVLLFGPGKISVDGLMSRFCCKK